LPWLSLKHVYTISSSNCPTGSNGARFDVRGLKALQAALGGQAADDPDLRHVHNLTPAELAAVRRICHPLRTGASRRIPALALMN
jgi:hypothetical protein